MDPALVARVGRAFNSPGHPVAFSAPGRVAKHFGISEKKAREALEHYEGYTLHREYKKPRHYNVYYVHNRRELVQGDLIDVGQLSRQNSGTKFLLLLIDAMTKKVWVVPLKTKSAPEMEAAMRRWLADIDRPPDKLQTDRGNEFTNRRVQDLLRSRGVEWQSANGTLKASMAERANKSLQLIIFKYLKENQTAKYLDVLGRLVETYNGRKHRTLKGMTPAEADQPANEARVQAVFHDKYAKAARHRKQKLPFSVGDTVRIKTEPRSRVATETRAYAQQFKNEYFTVFRINRTLPVAMYYLRSMDTNEEIEGGFYAQELQRQRGDTFKIDRILRRRRGRDGREELYVSWKFFGPQHNSWIPAGNIVRRWGRGGRRGRR